MMKNFLLLLVFTSLFRADGFRESQLKFSRVQAAYAEKKAVLGKLFREKKIEVGQMELFLRAFKHEAVLEIWAKNKTDQTFRLLTWYPFCATSGVLGPKRQEGDEQIPEGFYVIDRFNPKSLYHLSLGLNYPNAADKTKGKGKLGGDIFIHGDCVTIGCITLTDDKIKEVYILAVEAFHNGQTSIPVHLFPARFNGPAYPELAKIHATQPHLMAFWENLKAGYAHFEETRTLPKMQVSAQGDYVVE